jgi:glycosyltransferase involved in cell wall biosynthesis
MDIVWNREHRHAEGDSDRVIVEIVGDGLSNRTNLETVPQRAVARGRTVSNAAPEAIDCISVCICTFRRPVLLARLLHAIASQERDPRFRVNVVIVDNDAERSAEPVARSFQRGDIDMIYDVEPDRNISLARNRAIRKATGNLVAFIDDDERPVDDWLVQLYRTWKAYGVDGVLGPVIPEVPSMAPEWLRKERFAGRRRLQTGTRITQRDARTGNVLLRRSLFTDKDRWFDPALGRSGGEDSDFFRRQFQLGQVFVRCDEAIAGEILPPERWTASYHVKRYWRSGTLTGEWMREGRLPSSSPALVKNLLLLCTGLPLGLFTLLLRKHLRVRVWQKLAYCGGMVAAFNGFSLLRDRW